MSHWLCENDLNFLNALYRHAWPPGDLHTQPGTPAPGVILLITPSKVHRTKVTSSLGTAGPPQPAPCKVSADLSPPPRKPFMKPVLLLIDSLNVPLLLLNFFPLNFLPLYLSMSCTSFQILPPSSSSAKVIPHSSHPHNTSPHALYTHSNCYPCYSWIM